MAARTSFACDLPLQGQPAAAAALPKIASTVRVESVRARLAGLATCLDGLNRRRIDAERRFRDADHALPDSDDASIDVWNWKVVVIWLHYRALMMTVPGIIETKPPLHGPDSIVRLQPRG